MQVLETNSDQRLPLKKRHYHVSASSITSNNHQTHSESKNRSEKHSHAHSNEMVSSLPASTFEATSKGNFKANNAPKNSENLKSKIDSQKTHSKIDAQKHSSKSETSKLSAKTEATKHSTKHDSHKISKTESTKHSSKIESTKHLSKTESTKHSSKAELSKHSSKTEYTKHLSKSDAHKSTMKTDMRKISSKPDNTKLQKHESSKIGKIDDTKINKSDKVENLIEKTENDNMPVTPKKRHRLEEERKITKELLPFLPLRRSGRKKADSPSPEGKSKAETKNVASNKSKNEIEMDTVHERSSSRKHSRQNTTSSGKRSNSSCSKSSTTSSKNDSTDKITKKLKIVIDEFDVPPVFDIPIVEPRECSNEANAPASGTVSVTTTPTKLQINNKPQLITPLPSEPVPVCAANLKPPAGVFEPSRKLPTSLAKCKKTSIADVLSKLQEKLKDLDSPLKNTSTLMEKIGVAANEDPNSDRVLRSKRTGTETESISAKKTRICKDMSIRLRKLSSSEIANSGGTTTEQKPKLKRRKTINRTGFPVKKKKKRIKINSESVYDTGEDTNVDSTTEDEKTDTKEDKSPETSAVVGKVKNELIEEQTNKNENIENKPPNLRPIDAVKVKSEVMSEDEITRSGVRSVTKNKKKIIKSDIPSRLLPSRCSARIYIKQQIRAREIKKSKKKAVKKAKNKKKSKINAAAEEKICTEVAGKVLRPRECKKEPVKENKEIRLKSDNDRESKSRDETDREEFRYEKIIHIFDGILFFWNKPIFSGFCSDTDSVKCQNLKKVDVPKWKRKYISAGLFSEFYKEEK